MIVSKEMRPKAVYFPLDCTLFFLSFVCMVLFVWVYIAFIETRFLMDLDPAGNLRKASRTRHNKATQRATDEKTNKRTRACGSPHCLFKDQVLLLLVFMNLDLTSSIEKHINISLILTQLPFAESQGRKSRSTPPKSVLRWGKAHKSFF